MLCSWPEFFTFFYRSTFGCLFSCFGIRDVRTRQSSPVVSQQNTEHAVSRNRKRLSSLSLSQEKSNGSLGDEKQFNLLDCPNEDLDLKGLTDEVKFLKACGTLAQTPAEIRKASILLNGSSPTRDLESSDFHSWLPTTSIKKLNLEMEHDQPPTPNKQCEDWLSNSGSSTHEANRQMVSTCALDSNAGNIGIGVHDYASQTASVPSRNKSVCFNCTSDTPLSSLKSSSSEAFSQSSEQSEPRGYVKASKLSPKPTPLKLTDDMQTPGTVFPSYRENIVVGKNPRIRTQYVQSVANPIENFPSLHVLTEEDSNSDDQSGHMIKVYQEADNANPKPEPRILNNSVEEEMKVEESLSSCMKPLTSNKCANDQRVVTFASDNTYFGKTPGDRPVLGTVAIHWNVDEPSLVSPKLWDANGIPNSTRKYKEDQKVSWHATPFEERLEKALSEKQTICQRRNLNGTPPPDFNENMHDTAVSQKECHCPVPADVL